MGVTLRETLNKQNPQPSNKNKIFFSLITQIKALVITLYSKERAQLENLIN